MGKAYKPAPYTALTRECVHGVPPSLACKLSQWMRSCPTCVITRLVFQLEILQSTIAKRGGIFKQKEAHPVMHVCARKEWVTAKLELRNTVDRLEDLLKDEEMGVKNVAMLKEALQVWEQKRDGLINVPGVSYADKAEEDEPTEEEKEGARLLMVWLKMVLEKEMSQEELEDVATPTPQLHQQDVAVRQYKSPLSTTPPVTPPKGPQTNFQQSSSTTSAPNPTPATLFEPQQTRFAPPTTPKTHTTMLSPVNTQQKVATPKSNIKRPCIDTPPGSPLSSADHKRVRIADRVTISPQHLNVVNPLTFESLPRTQITVPHAAHTVAEHRRRKREFHRGKNHVPGVWASKDSTIKVDTSFFRVKSDMMELLLKKELILAETEMETLKQLKLIANHWVVLWWAEHVVPQLDLEMLLAEMGQLKKQEEA